ncbi:exonuclease domain-containing protein [Lactobacillus sp. LL6]|uniref:exonuclease domain-containing protein n=1 Tax=Lactobacillus sp. LL6 TaxID=2596827 RepID=UPI001185D82C|nr:exonuclease domain-containing protein [Lactobacillus sp. LL6]TSO26823.1 3'-5' exonuclease [Lactobacillus sp. LL6]
MSIFIKEGILYVSGSQDKLRHKGKEIIDFISDYTLIDIETTGLSPFRDRITELGGIKVRDGEVVDKYSHLIKYPQKNTVPAFITKLNGITQEMIEKDGIPVKEAIHDFREFIGDDVIIGYNINFDLNFVYDLAKKYNEVELNNDYVDVFRLARAFYPNERHNRLLDCMQRIGIAQIEQHRGLDDSLDTKKVYDYFHENFTNKMFDVAKSQIKDVNLVNDKLEACQVSFRNPLNFKKVVLSGNLHFEIAEMEKVISNMNGQIQEIVDSNTDYLVMGDHDFFRHDNENLELARQYIKEGAKIKRLSESFFLSMLDDWARS